MVDVQPSDSSDADLDAFASSNSLGACIGTGNLERPYASGKVAFYESGRVLWWRGAGDVVEISNDVIAEAGGGEVSREALGSALVMLAAQSALNKYGDW